jgi:hypothetical protein
VKDMDKMRAVLALLVVGVFMVITAVMALYPLLSASNVDLGSYSDFFAKTSSVYTGIIGVIIGFYFGRSTSQAEKGAQAEKGKPGDTTDVLPSTSAPSQQ